MKIIVRLTNNENNKAAQWCRRFPLVEKLPRPDVGKHENSDEKMIFSPNCESINQSLCLLKKIVQFPFFQP